MTLQETLLKIRDEYPNPIIQVALEGNRTLEVATNWCHDPDPVPDSIWDYLWDCNLDLTERRLLFSLILVLKEPGPYALEMLETSLNLSQKPN